MRSLERKRQAEQAQALRPTAVSARLVRLWTVQAEGLTAETDSRRLPPDTLRSGSLLSASGAPKLMLDYDGLDLAPLG